MPRIIVCADDFALSPAVSRAILDLIGKKSITATSCMTSMPEWPDLAKNLSQYKEAADIGLHFTLTGGAGLPDFGDFMRRAYLGRIDLRDVGHRLNNQLDLFEKSIDRAPDYIDGHQYVHQLPGVRDVLIRIIQERYPAGRIYVRQAEEKIPLILKRGIACMRALSFCIPGKGLKEKLIKAGIPTNSGFCGIYDFDEKTDYPKIFQKFIKGVTDNTILVTHPGKVDGVLKSRDTLTYQREREYAFLESADFCDLMKQSGIQPGRFQFA